MGLTTDFLRHLKAVRNCSPHTIRAYEGDLTRFTAFLGGEGAILGVDVPQLRRFLLERATRNYSKASTARTLACLRTFYGWLVRNGRLETNSVKLMRGPRLDKKLPGFLEEGEVERLIAAAAHD